MSASITREMVCKSYRACLGLSLHVFVLAWVPAMVASGEPATPTYAIACIVDAEQHVSITPALVADVNRQIHRAYEAILGADQSVRFLHSPDAMQVPPITEMTPELLDRLRAGFERLLIVRLSRDSNEYVVQAREYDARFQMLGSVTEIRTMQREMVADSAGRAALQVFTPLAIVRSATGTNVQIEILGGRRLVDYRHWLGLSGDVGLQVMRESVAPAGETGDRPRATRYRHTFLALRSWEGDRAECELIGPDKLFRDLDSGTARYVARPVRAANTTPQVQVVRRDSRQPQPDCEIFVSQQQYSTDPALLRGLTDRTGTLRVNLSAGGLQFVCVRYEDLVLKAPLLPGASADPIVFEVPTRGRRAEFIRPLRQLLQEIDDQYLVDLRLREELKARVEAKDTAEVRRLIERGRSQRIALGEVEARVLDVERRAMAEGEDVREAAAQVRQNAAQKISQQLDQALLAYSDWADKFDKKSHVESLTARINDLQDRMEWDALVPVFEELVQADPSNAKVAEELRLLKNDLKVKGPEHSQAREFVNRELKNITTNDLSRRWQEIDREAHALLKAKDHLTLLKLRRAMNLWARDLAQEVKGLIDQVQAAAGGDELRVQQLRDQLDQLNTVNQSITKLHKEIQAFLETLKL